MKMKRSTLQLLALVLSAVMLTSCQSYSYAHRGAVNGALLGAGVGALIGSGGGNAGRGALIGGLAGSLGGAYLGNRKDGRIAYYRYR